MDEREKKGFSMKFKITGASILCLAAFTYSASKTTVGSPASMLEKLKAQNTAMTRVFTFPTPGIEQITVDV